jgi:hypothetical protein
MEDGIPCTPAGGIRQGVVRVEQATEFNDPKDDHEEQ